MALVYTPYIWPEIVSATIVTLLAVGALRYPASPGFRAFIGLMLAVSGWSVLYALELVTADPGLKLLWAKLEYPAIVATPVAFLLFAARYTRQERWLRRPHVLLLAIVPVVTVLLDWTDEYHGLVHSSRQLATSGPPSWRLTYGPWFWVWTAYSYVVLLAATVLLLRHVTNSSQLYRRQAVVIVTVVAVPWAANLLGVTGQTGGLDVTPVGFAIAGLVLAWGYARGRLLDLVPISRGTILAAVSDPVLVIDRASRVLDANPAASRLLGRAVGDLTGRPAVEVLGQTLGSPLSGVLSVKGQHFECRVSVLADRSNREIGRLLFLRDLSDRDRADREHSLRLEAERERDARAATEGALRASEARLQQVLTAARMGTWEWDLQSDRIVGSQQAAVIHGLAPDDFGGQPAEVLETVRPRDRHRLRHLRQRLQPGSDQVQVEYGVAWPDGSEHWVASFGQVFRAADGQAIRLAGVVMDITDRKLAERQTQVLAQSEKLRALGQMASGIAHDLNQSLALISGYAELARHELDSNAVDRARLGEIFGIAVNAAQDAGHSVKRLLAFARTKDGYKPEDIDAAELLRDVANLTLPRWRDAAQAEGRRISVEVEAVDGLHMEGSLSALREALTNLVFNAVDALPAGGTIRLCANAEGEQLVLEVRDTGTGMPREVQARAFDPFYTTKGERGTGLGLAQVLAIVQSHRGEITLNSTPGKGTTFVLHFPLARAAATPEPESPRIVQTPDGQRLTILAVDDEEQLARLVAQILSKVGHRVTTATSGEQALKMLAESPVDVVISDLGMGEGMDGWQLARVVRDAWPRTQFVLATGWGAAIDVEGLAERGVDTLLAKPYRVKQLRELVAELSHNAGHRAEHAYAR